MTDNLFSSSWYRVANLKPQIRPHARVQRQCFRDHVWFVLQNRTSGKHYRFNPAAHFVIGLMDGKRSIEEIWEAAGTQLGDDAPTQDETIQLLGKLHAADVLQCDVPPDSLELLRRLQRQQRQKWHKRLMSPLSQRFPLCDPETFLNLLLPLVRPLFSWGGLMVWLTLVGAAGILAASHWSELTENILDSALGSQNLLLLLLTYPVVKLLHELGHAFATKVWGGEVHEMGIMFMVFMPIPYVDASAATSFPEKRRRMAVGAAGIMVESFLASLALFAWLNLEPGTLHALAYNVMLIGGVSTLFFNGNPLLRFDGYYVLADAIEIPNLAARSNQYLVYLLQRYWFGLSEARSPAESPGERRWFFGYGIAAFIYRICILLAISLYVAGKFFVVGIVLAIWATTTQLLLPVFKGIAFVLNSPKVRRNRIRALATSSTTLAVCLAVVFYLPIPRSTQAHGVVWMPEKSQVRASAEGFIARILVAPDTRVRRGDPLIETEDPLLTARIAILDAQVQELTSLYQAEKLTDLVQSEIRKEELASVQAEHHRAQERAAQLVIRSPADGIFVLAREQDLPGRFLQQGELIAHVIDFSKPIARVVVDQRDVDLVRRHTESVALRPADRIDQILPGAIRREVPGASNRLPSRALGSTGGGKIATDPTDPEGVKTLQSVFQFELQLPADSPLPTVGGRVFVRFDHGKATLAQRWYRGLRQLFLKRFGV